jgi:hypothetical protein
MAVLAGCSMEDVATIRYACQDSGVNATVKFLHAGRVAGVNIVALGQSVLEQVLSDPLLSQYSLTLVSWEPLFYPLGSTLPVPPTYGYEEDDGTYDDTEP